MCKRDCPACGQPVYVTKSVTPSKDHSHVERLQAIRCSSCGLRGTLTIKEDISWRFPDLPPVTTDLPALPIK